jgi:hypothetical protein
MTQPQGYIDPQHPSHVCKLLKSIYGLTQAPRAWFESFTSQLLHLGFTASTTDSSLFIYKHNSIIAYLLLYVDDIVLTSNTPAYLDQLVTQLSTVFDLKDLGSLHYFLGLQVTRSPTGLYLNQAKYAHDLLKKHNMLDSKPASSLAVLILDSHFMKVILLLILMVIEVWLELFTTSLLQDQTSPSLSIKFANTCLPLLLHILLLPREFSDTYGALLNMV